MNIILDPTLIFSNLTDWADNNFQKSFLRHFLNFLDVVDVLSDDKIYWNDDLEAELWQNKVPPWIYERDLKNVFLPIYYKRFNPKKILIDSNQYNPCIIEPTLDDLGYPNIIISFLKLAHSLKDNNIQSYFVLGIKNNSSHCNYIFKCDCNLTEYKPTAVFDKADWLNKINIVDEFWPQSLDEIGKFDKAIMLSKQIFFKNKPLLNRYSFSEQFKNDIVGLSSYKDEFIKNVTKRLISTSHQASKDPVLKDEYLKSTKEYRFRVTPRPSSTRIHYIYKEKEIHFLKFYNVGEHDDGL